MARKIVGVIDWDVVGPRYKQLVEFLIKTASPVEDGVTIHVVEMYFQKMELFVESDDPDDLEKSG
jgi:hypothetical protein